MEANAMTAPEVERPKGSTNRKATLAVMAITGAIIFAVAFIANQPAASSGNGITTVTLTGDQSGAAPEVGKAAPGFTATTVDGKTVSLTDFKGHPVWLTFGASWCQPCRAENPDIQATYDKFKGKGVVVLAIFITEDPATVKDYATRVGLTYDKVADPETKISSEYRILGIPSHFFIDASGVLRQMRIGSMDVPAMEAALTGISG